MPHFDDDYGTSWYSEYYDDDPNYGDDEWDDYDAYIEVATDLTVRELFTTRHYPVSERLAALWTKSRWWWHRKTWWAYEPLRKLYYRVTGKPDPLDEIPF